MTSNCINATFGICLFQNHLVILSMLACTKFLIWTHLLKWFLNSSLANRSTTPKGALNRKRMTNLPNLKFCLSERQYFC